MTERIKDEAESLAYAALDSADPAHELAMLGWTAGDYLEPWGGQSGGYFDALVLQLIRDLRTGNETHECAINRLLVLGHRVVDATAASERCIAEAVANVFDESLVED